MKWYERAWVGPALFASGMVLTFQLLVGTVPAYDQIKMGKTPAQVEANLRYGNWAFKPLSRPGREIAYVPSRLGSLFSGSVEDAE
ncbi:hypothetical protein CMO91_04085 [Candidatus Woesearchaeota archaeon]|nr:hypothetical protein [Candidatus Woesearchaeota archaeon]